MYNNAEFTHIKKTSKTLEEIKRVFLNGNSAFYSREIDNVCKIPLLLKLDEDTQENK